MLWISTYRWCVSCFLLCIFLTTPLARTQQELKVPSTRSANDFLKPEVHSDAMAVGAMQDFLAGSGGVKLWRTVRSSQLRLRRDNAESDPTPIIFADDWSTEKTVYRRGAVGSSRTVPLTHDGSPTFNVRIHGKDQSVPEFDQGRTLADHVPAAAAEVMLRTASYIFRLAKEPDCDSLHICVLVYRLNITAKFFMLEQQWFFLRATRMPDKLLLRVINVTSTHLPPWETVEFGDFTSREGVISPGHIAITPPSRPRRSYVVVSSIWNKQLDPKSFDKELVK